MRKKNLSLNEKAFRRYMMEGSRGHDSDEVELMSCVEAETNGLSSLRLNLHVAQNLQLTWPKSRLKFLTLLRWHILPNGNSRQNLRRGFSQTFDEQREESFRTRFNPSKPLKASIHSTFSLTSLYLDELFHFSLKKSSH